MITLDGIEYTVKTPEENASDLVNYINDYCAANNIKNSKGEVINIAANETNPLYMILYGNAYLATVLQKLIYSAGCTMSVPESSEKQLLNIADIAGVVRNSATKTTIIGTVYAEESGGASCKIIRTLTCTVSSGTYKLAFHPAFDITIPAGEARQIVLICEDYGSYNISENTITVFDDEVAGFRKMTTLASIPGQDAESIASLRERIQRRTVQGTQADRAAEAIQSLDGVALCNIYFNESPTATQYVGSRALAVPPRQALVLVQGYSDDIAKTFFNHMICKTAGESYPLSVGAYVQNYVTKAGQTLPVYIVPPEQVPVYIKIYIYETLTYSQVDGIKDIICSLSSTVKIGQTVTSKMVTDIVSKNYPDLTIQGADVSSNGDTYSFGATPNKDAIFTFNLDNINVVEVTE